jgi:hypothetical protein
MHLTKLLAADSCKNTQLIGVSDIEEESLKTNEIEMDARHARGLRDGGECRCKCE